MNSTYLEAVEEFQTLAGVPYRGENFTSPESVPTSLFQVVRKAKLSEANARQRDIYYEMEAYKKGDIVILPDDKKHLVDDFEFWKDQIRIWNI